MISERTYKQKQAIYVHYYYYLCQSFSFAYALLLSTHTEKTMGRELCIKCSCLTDNDQSLTHSVCASFAVLIAVRWFSELFQGNSI